MSEKNELLVPWLRSRTNIALLVFLGIGGYFLFTEHWAHVIQALPYLLLVGCIVMHLFMHGGHGHGDDGGHQDDQLDSSGGKHER
jgi:hypothetical protein